MDNATFIDFCTQLVVDYTNNRLEVAIDSHDVYVVWLARTLQNNKALLSTNTSDGMYYEITLNGDKGEAYLDAYKKTENQVIKLDLKK